MFSAAARRVPRTLDLDFATAASIRCRSRIPTGTAHINDQTLRDDAHVPFGGVRNWGNWVASLPANAITLVASLNDVLTKLAAQAG